MKAVSIIPRPSLMEVQDGSFCLTPDTAVTSPGAFLPAAKLLARQLRRATGFPLPCRDAEHSGQGSTVTLEQAPENSSLGPAGYELEIASDGICLKAVSLQGSFHACQTLLQLFPAAIESTVIQHNFSWEIPQLFIRDLPRFAWRGMHLDVCRHFMPKMFVKKYIDLLTRYKLNIFHWHLTEDQGWRIEIKGYPKLTQIGAWRQEQGQSYGGFYTQDDVREIVEYAGERGVTIVPEIEMPGHAMAALAAYPELSCSGGPFELPTSWGIFDDVFCAGNERSFQFFETVLGEVLELFPGPYIHIGGDECPKTRWNVCPKCQERIATEDLHDENELQSYFIKRIEKFLSAHNRQLIGWDEILEGGLAPSAIVMSWRGLQGGVKAAELGHDVVMTPQAHCYFDYYQSLDRQNEPQAFDGYVPLENVYAFEPISPELSAEQAKYVLGGQGNLWTEYILDTQQAEYMLLPRMCALAEALWSEKEHRDLHDFIARLSAHYERFDVMGVSYRRSSKNYKG